MLVRPGRAPKDGTTTMAIQTKAVANIVIARELEVFNIIIIDELYWLVAFIVLQMLTELCAHYDM